MKRPYLWRAVFGCTHRTSPALSSSVTAAIFLVKLNRPLRRVTLIVRRIVLYVRVVLPTRFSD